MLPVTFDLGQIKVTEFPVDCISSMIMIKYDFIEVLQVSLSNIQTDFTINTYCELWQMTRYDFLEARRMIFINVQPDSKLILISYELRHVMTDQIWHLRG